MLNPYAPSNGAVPREAESVRLHWRTSPYMRRWKMPSRLVQHLIEKHKLQAAPWSAPLRAPINPLRVRLLNVAAVSPRSCIACACLMNLARSASRRAIHWPKASRSSQHSTRPWLFGGPTKFPVILPSRTRSVSWAVVSPASFAACGRGPNASSRASPPAGADVGHERHPARTGHKLMEGIDRKLEFLSPSLIQKILVEVSIGIAKSDDP